MKLLRLHIVGFGTLKEFRMDFCNGLNPLHRENGWGKSTLAVFIKAMLYGLPVTTKRSLDENERKKYTPWQGGEYGGSLEFSCKKGSFRIERFFAPKESGDTFELYDLATNLQSHAFSSALGEELLGIDADGFERTVYLSQRNTTSHGNNVSITAKLGNLLDDVDDISGFDNAMTLLDKRRKYYIMTGNRGHIADLEQERNERQAELESLYRTRDALNALQQELNGIDLNIATVQTTIDHTRSELQTAALWKEQAALSEQRQRMESELARLRQKATALTEFFHGSPPTESELDEFRRLLRQSNEITARIDANSEKSTFPCHFELLSITENDQLPNEQLLAKLIAENAELQKICHRETVLKTAHPNSAIARFPHGVPSAEKINAAFASMEQAKKLRRAAQEAELTQANLPPSPRPVPAVLSILLGVLLFVSAVLPPLSRYLLPLMIAGGCCLTVGATLTWHMVKKRLKQKEALERSAKQAKQLRQTADNEQAAALALLNAYGMSADSDPIRALTELALLSRQYTAERQQETQIAAELQTLQQNKSKTLSFLLSGFRLYGLSLPVKDDYRDEIEALRRDVALLHHFRQEEKRRLQIRTEAELEQTRLHRQLLPLLNRYGHNPNIRLEDFLNTLTVRTAEYRRITDELLQRKTELQRFVAEKQPEEASDTPPPAVDYQTLVAREKALQTELVRLQGQQADLRSRLERLATDNDRIPEAEEQLVRCKELIKEAKANSATITATMRFLEESKTALSTRYLDDMQTEFRRFLSLLIGKDAPESIMNTEFEVSVRTDGKTHPTESFSRGWRDAIRFCTCLSLTAALYKDGEKPFLLLDDPFVNLDDERLTAAKKMIAKLSDTYQIIYMVCNADRM